jgi:hypothetical protein
MLETIRWHGAGSIALLNGLHIYINPRRVARPNRPADAILIGSGQYDHCSPADIDKLRGEHTRIIISESVAAHIPGAQILRPWQSTALGSACIKGVPVDTPGDLGFIVSSARYDIYYTGRTSTLPTCTALHPDMVILPIDGDHAVEDLRTLRAMHPRWIVPYGWDANGISRAGRARAHAFAGQFSPDQVVILDPTLE